MTVLERKAEFIKSILNDTDEQTFLELEKVYQALTTEKPCRFSHTELNRRAVNAELDFEAGRGKTHEEMKRKHAI